MRSDLSAHRRQGIAWKVALCLLFVVQAGIVMAAVSIIIHFVRKWW